MIFHTYAKPLGRDAVWARFGGGVGGGGVVCVSSNKAIEGMVMDCCGEGVFSCQ